MEQLTTSDAVIITFVIIVLVSVARRKNPLSADEVAKFWATMSSAAGKLRRKKPKPDEEEPKQ